MKEIDGRPEGSLHPEKERKKKILRSKGGPKETSTQRDDEKDENDLRSGIAKFGGRRKEVAKKMP